MHVYRTYNITCQPELKSEVVHKTRGATSSAYRITGGSHRSACDKVLEPPLVNHHNLCAGVSDIKCCGP